MTSDLPTDRRVRRTRALLHDALLSLIPEKGYERITVQDILDRADVGRSTFYAHYRDKEDLLLSGFQDIRSALTAERQAADHSSGARGEFLEPLRVVFRHVEGHRHLREPLSRKGGADLVTRILRDSVADIVREHFRAQFPEYKSDPALLEPAVQFVSGACMTLLIWWLADDGALTADDIYANFRRFATQGVRRALTAG
jgi:AcrR family transcriptional regulator